MSDEHAAVPALESEQRHRVRPRQRDGRHGIDVRAVGIVEPSPPHGVGEEGRMHPLWSPATVLVGLHSTSAAFGVPPSLDIPKLCTVLAGWSRTMRVSSRA